MPFEHGQKRGALRVAGNVYEHCSTLSTQGATPRNLPPPHSFEHFAKASNDTRREVQTIRSGRDTRRRSFVLRIDQHSLQRPAASSHRDVPSDAPAADQDHSPIDSGRNRTPKTSRPDGSCCECFRSSRLRRSQHAVDRRLSVFHATPLTCYTSPDSCQNRVPELHSVLSKSLTWATPSNWALASSKRSRGTSPNCSSAFSAASIPGRSKDEHTGPIRYFVTAAASVLSWGCVSKYWPLSLNIGRQFHRLASFSEHFESRRVGIHAIQKVTFR